MPRYQVEGRGKDTGRKRKREYDAQTEADARRLAEDDGTEVVSVVELPPEPATDKQLSYAKDLGIKIPSDPTKEQLSYLISERVDPPATKSQLYCLQELGITFPSNVFASEGRVAYFISEHVGDGVNRELARWYLYGVERWLNKEPWETPDQSSLTKDQVYSLADQMVGDPKVLKSLLRELEPSHSGVESSCRFTLPTFSTSSAWEHGVLSLKTITFKSARKLVANELGIEEQQTASRSNGSLKESKAKSGCFGVVVLGVGLFGGAVYLMDKVL
jgi:hypothetical protein